MTCTRIRIKGIVQGVGFRPFVYRLAKELGIRGWVRNTLGGVEILACGRTDEFIRKIKREKPLPAVFEKIETESGSAADLPETFVIRESHGKGEKELLISPDIAVCGNCLKEFLDPADRRQLFPFINCTDCGPRYTIIEDLPYDREHTAMAGFKMCPDCREEYGNVSTRRFHAQPDCCFDCGPEISLEVDGQSLPAGEAGEKGEGSIKKTAGMIKSGRIIAVKGLGGFHIICDAFNGKAVKTLRKRKKRPKKPFALMMRDVSAVKKYCELSHEEEKILTSWRRPILLLKKKKNSRISDETAPGNNYLGVMLPYTPLHYLLMKELEVIVCTSGNRGDEPVEYENGLAKKNLSDIADGFLFHNRPIINPLDDSVVAHVPGAGEVIFRRSRGFVPLPIRLPVTGQRSPGILGMGGEENSTFCISKNGYAFLSPYLGDMRHSRCEEFYRKTLKTYFHLFGFKPKELGHDLHPDYRTTRMADEFPVKKKREVQHHHAHLISVLAGHQRDDKALGIIWDGTGYGADGKLWGSEFMFGDRREYKRLAHLDDIPLPGGEKAVLEPWRTGYAVLKESGLEEEAVKIYQDYPHKVIDGMLGNNINLKLSSGMGRLFDAVSSILGLIHKISFDAEGAVTLQMIAERGKMRGKKYSFSYLEKEGRIIIDWRPLIRGIIGDIKRIKKEDIAFKFHVALADMIEDVLRRLKKKEKIKTLALSGGVWQNRLLLEMVLKRLKKRYKVLLPKGVPFNDESVSLGQSGFLGSYNVNRGTLNV